MARPYDLFLRFLITQGMESVEELNQKLESLHILPIPQVEFQQIYEGVHTSLPEIILNQIEKKQYEGDFLRWMRMLEVEELWLGEPRFKKKGKDLSLIYGIFSDPILKLTINALLTKGIDPKDLSPMLNSKFSSMLREEHIQIYSRFFWNPRRMTRTDWRAYLGQTRPVERNALFTALTEDLEEVKACLGLPARTNVSDALQYLLSQSYRKAKHYLKLSNDESNREARAWIKETVNLAEKYEKYRSGDVMDFGKELQLEFDYITSEFPTPDEQIMKEVLAKSNPEASRDASQQENSAPAESPESG